MKEDRSFSASVIQGDEYQMGDLLMTMNGRLPLKNENVLARYRVGLSV